MYNESGATRTYITCFAILCMLVSAAQGGIHFLKWLNISEFNDANSGLGENPYDVACWQGSFTDKRIVEERKASICNAGQDSDCLKTGSNWTYIYFINGIAFAALTYVLLEVGFRVAYASPETNKAAA